MYKTSNIERKHFSLCLVVVASFAANFFKPFSMAVVVDYLPSFHPRSANLRHKLVVVFFNCVHLQPSPILSYHFGPVDLQIWIFCTPHQDAVLESPKAVVAVRMLPTKIEAPSIKFLTARKKY